MEIYQRKKKILSICLIINVQVNYFHIFMIDYRADQRLFLFLAVDWIIADMLAIRQSALGHVRYVLKDGLKWLPLYGWYFSQVMQLCEYMNVIC